MRRRLDKGITDLEKLSKSRRLQRMHLVVIHVWQQMNLTFLRPFLLADSEIAFSKTGFELKLKSILWFLIHGSQVVMVLWFRKSSVFYLPPGWFGPLDRLLCLPFSPLGKTPPPLLI